MPRSGLLFLAMPFTLNGMFGNTHRIHRIHRIRSAGAPGRSSPTFRSRLAAIAMAAPLCAQTLMVVMLLAQGQWMFAIMVIPGAIGCLASMLLVMAQDSSHDAGAPQPSAETGTSSPAESDTFATLGSYPLEDALAFDHLPWRGIVGRWTQPFTLDVPIGVAAQGTCTLDLLRQGPHALVAGTTGSGKSVLLQSWCLALAAANGPDRLNFVFLDFKGGSAFRPLEHLPHTVGNVCDLDLAHATRALQALEAELVRRERLMADCRAAHIDDLASPVPRLIVVIDEFHALKEQLPDYIGRLVRIASLGRSLGMHLIACTQNPLGQVNADMKANMSISICLRVRDALQSAELLGDGRASRIPPAMPGAAYCNDADRVSALRCMPIRDVDVFCRHIVLAARFMGLPPAAPLFTAPLPSSVSLRDRPSPVHDRLWFGLADDGVAWMDATIAIGAGNIGIIAGPGRGKSTLLSVMADQAMAMTGLAIRVSELHRGVRRERVIRRPGDHAVTGPAAPQPPKSLWLVDDADDLFDPFRTDEEALSFQSALADPATTVVFAVASNRHVRVPEHCNTRIVFPTGERTADLVAGIPSQLLSSLSQRDLDTPGRAVLVTGISAYPVQCAS